MNCIVETTTRFDKEFKKLDRYTQRIIRAWIIKHLVNCEASRIYGKALTANCSNLWRYLIGDYRLLCEIRDAELVILALNVRHRREVYK